MGIFNENILIFINISLKFIPNGPTDHTRTLVDIVTCFRTGDQPLSQQEVAFLTVA